MLTPGIVLQWLTQRSCELVLGAALALAILGANAPGGEFGDLESFRQNIYYVLFFFVSSGYVITTAGVAFARRGEGPLLRAWISVALFVAHAVGFLLFTGQIYSKRMGMLVVFGASVVAFSSLVGESLRAGLERRRSCR